MTHVVFAGKGWLTDGHCNCPCCLAAATVVRGVDRMEYRTKQIVLGVIVFYMHILRVLGDDVLGRD